MIGSPPGAGPSPGRARVVVEQLVDAALEASVVGSFSVAGIAVRRAMGRRSGTWAPLPPMAGRVVVVTGGSSGIGLAAAADLAAAGAHVHLVARRPEPLAGALSMVESAAGDGSAAGTLADLADPGAVRRAGAELLGRHDRIDAVVHAAGALTHERRAAADGTEMTAAVGLLGPDLLTRLLAPALAAAGGGRVLVVTSGGLYTQRFDVGRLDPPAADYDGVAAYARVKRAQLVLAGLWARRLGAQGTACFATHPGWVDTPGLRSGLPRFARALGPALRRPADGADTVVWLAGGPEGAAGDGRLWHDRRPRAADRVPWTWVPAAARRRQQDELQAWLDAHPAWRLDTK